MSRLALIAILLAAAPLRAADDLLDGFTSRLSVSAADSTLLEDADQAAAKEPAPASGAPAESPRLRTFEMPPTVVTGSPSGLREEDRIGSYGQPRWTAHRRFPTTRVYVIPEGEIDFENWTRVKVGRTPGGDPAGKVSWEHRQEVEVGLPGRFQLDFYLIERHQGHDLRVDQSIEIRWALADWGKLWGNPTLYFEYINQDTDDEKIEAKILLGDELAPRVHWGVNLVYERILGSPFTEEYELTAGLSYTLIDEVLSIGAEAKLAIENEKDNRSAYEEDYRIGPSLQWKPVPAMHIDLAPLFGLTHESKFMDLFLVIGWEF